MTTHYRLTAPSAEQLHDLPVHTELRLPSMPSSPIVKTRTEDGVPWLASVQVERRLGREVTASWYGSGDLAAAIGDGIVEVTLPSEPHHPQPLGHDYRGVEGSDECTALTPHPGHPTARAWCRRPEADHR